MEDTPKRRGSKKEKTEGGEPEMQAGVPQYDDGAGETDTKVLKIYKNIGQNIRMERITRGLTIEQLAELLELSSSYIGLLERGTRCPSLKNLFRLCYIFECTPDSLITDKKNFSGKKHAFAESQRDSYTNKYNAVISLLKGMDEEHLDVVIATIKGLRNMKKGGAAKKVISAE